jgi:uncharacterized protein YbaP (TraB family)
MEKLLRSLYVNLDFLKSINSEIEIKSLSDTIDKHEKNIKILESAINQPYPNQFNIAKIYYKNIEYKDIIKKSTIYKEVKI